MGIQSTVPEGWAQIRLDSAGKVVTGTTPPTADRSNYGFDRMFASPADLGRTKYVTQTGKMLSERGYTKSRAIPAGSTMFVCIGSTIGKVGLATEDMTTNQQINSIVPNGSVDSEFLYYAATRLSTRIRALASEQAVPMVNKTEFSAFEIAAPSDLGDQRAIAVALADVDELVVRLESMIHKKEQINQGVRYELLTGHVRLPGFSDEWSVSQLGKHLEFKNGLNKSSQYFGSGTPIVNFMDVMEGPIVSGDDVEGRVTLTKDEIRRFSARQGDLFFTRTSETVEEVGTAAVLADHIEDATFSGFILRGRLRGVPSDPVFLAYLCQLESIRRQIVAAATYTTRALTNGKTLSRVAIRVPTVKEQQAITAVLCDLDAEIQGLRDRLRKIEDLKVGMVQELLSGRALVPQGEGGGMSNVGQLERKAQEHVVDFFKKSLKFEYLGNWEKREANSNIEVEWLEANLKERGYDDNLINKALMKLASDASLGGGRDLYEANKDVYGLLRYGVHVKPGIGENTETVWLIDWDNPNANHFALAEEVTVAGNNVKRPDLVLYVNGIAVATIELKRSKVAVSEGIRQTIGNQKAEFIRPFFTTVQLVIAGNDVEGVRYGVIDTPEKYWLEWREDSQIAEPLDRGLSQLCSKDRLLELIHDFIVFDAGVKKICRHNQYFGVKAAEARIAQRDGGIIWHTQGSGKSLTMVWLAKWLREHEPDARVLLITDRTELDEQIEGVFKGVDEDIYRTSSGLDLVSTLNKSSPWLICSLIHKFRGSEDEDARDEADQDFITELHAKLPPDFSAKGNFFVFVDEAHRTQSGKMHDAMTELMPDAMFIGFTGTPLLKQDKETSIEKFGSFIHTYKFDEAVMDGVVLDLRYEARTIDQELMAPDKVDKWFEAKTKGMTDLSRAELKKRWGTMQKVVSAEPRARQIVNDILLDMEIKPRLMDGRGNAILIGSSIYQACKFYELFCQAGFKGKCAIVTSYEPHAGDISKEDSGEGATERLRQYEIYRQMLADHFDEPADEAVGKVELFEKQVKDRFVKEPGQMRLLIVVDKLLTGFDAPSATYLYIDKKMQNHGLFQAICRVNRLDGEDKDYGYIVDYRDLFKSLESAITEYTGGALDGYEKKDIEGLLTDRIEKAREDLDDALDRIRALCEPVAPPKNTLQFQQFFCAAEQGNVEQLKSNEPKRVELYKSVANVVRCFGNLANEMLTAGYTEEEAAKIKEEVAHYANVRDEVKLGAGEDVDLKQYEAGMRQLLDTYISAKPSETLADFGDATLIDLIVKMGSKALDKLPQGIKKDPEAVAETITNNIRKVIIDERPMNPKYYDRMSELLDALLDERRQGAIDYKTYLERLLKQAADIGTGEGTETPYPEWADNGARRALVDFFGSDAVDVAAEVDKAIRHSKPDSWVGNKLKEKKVKTAIQGVLPPGFDQMDDLFDLVRARNEYQ